MNSNELARLPQNQLHLHGMRTTGEKEEVIRKAQPLYGKPNRAGHFPCDNYGYNQA